MKKGNCELCGEWAGQLVDGVCHPCIRRLIFVERPAVDVEQYTLELTGRVREILADAHNEIPSDEVIEGIICEALFQTARDVAAGRTVRLEYIGELNPVGDQGVIYTPTDWVLPSQQEAAL